MGREWAVGAMANAFLGLSIKTLTQRLFGFVGGQAVAENTLAGTPLPSVQILDLVAGASCVARVALR